MKSYTKPTIEFFALRAEESIANPHSGGLPNQKGNNGFGNGDQSAPGGSLNNNGAENKQIGKK